MTFHEFIVGGLQVVTLLSFVSAFGFIFYEMLLLMRGK